jgi:hypothetical protein
MRGIIHSPAKTAYTPVTKNAMIQLGTNDIIKDKPFTHTARTASDADSLERLRRTLARLLRGMSDDDCRCQQHLEFVEEDGRAMRHIVIRPQGLLDATALTIVGFCGQKRAPLGLQEQEEMAHVDAELVAELCEHPHMLSYCSIETGDGNWHNLVLLSHHDGIQHWRGSARHMWAVESLTPRFYQHIRLHNGALPDGLASERIVLTSTKYYDFSVSPPWRAIRML